MLGSHTWFLSILFGHALGLFLSSSSYVTLWWVLLSFIFAFSATSANSSAAAVATGTRSATSQETSNSTADWYIGHQSRDASKLVPVQPPAKCCSVTTSARDWRISISTGVKFNSFSRTYRSQHQARASRSSAIRHSDCSHYVSCWNGIP